MLNPMGLSGRRILVTGASSGLGREIAILFSQLDAAVVLAGRNRAALEATASQLEGTGHSIECFDLAALDDIPGWLKRIAGDGGPLAGLVHSAGLLALVPLQGLTVRKFDELVRVNLTAGLMLAKAFRQKGCSVPGGSIVLLSAALGVVGAPGATAYSATKAALIGAARSLAMEFAPQKIRVNCIAPGVVDTEMTQRLWSDLPPSYKSELEALYPLGFGCARDVANAAAFLMADTGRWITGTTLVLDGGFTAR